MGATSVSLLSFSTAALYVHLLSGALDARYLYLQTVYIKSWWLYFCKTS